MITVIDTNQNVWKTADEAIRSSTGNQVSYDSHTGIWAIIENQKILRFLPNPVVIAQVREIISGFEIYWPGPEIPLWVAELAEKLDSIEEKDVTIYKNSLR